jgi:hypothetical protein
MNIICMGGRTIGPFVAWELVETFLGAGSVRPGAAWVKWLPWSWKCPPKDNHGEIT